MFSWVRRFLNRVSMLVVRPEQGHICLVLLAWAHRFSVVNYLSGVVVLIVVSRGCRVVGLVAKHRLGVTLAPLKP